VAFLVLDRAGYGRELLMLEKVLPILGPSKFMTAITTIATRAIIIAYSTRPWPFSLGANNMVLFLSNKLLPEAHPQNFYSITISIKNSRLKRFHFIYRFVSVYNEIGV